MFLRANFSNSTKHFKNTSIIVLLKVNLSWFPLCSPNMITICNLWEMVCFYTLQRNFNIFISFCLNYYFLMSLFESNTEFFAFISLSLSSNGSRNLDPRVIILRISKFYLDAYLDNHYCYTSARVNTLAAYRDNPKLLTAYEADVVAYVDSASTPSDATDSKLTSKSTEIDFSDANRKPLVFGAPFSGGNETSTFSFASADKPAIAKFDFGKPSAETPNSLFPNFSGLSKPLLPVTNATANASASQSPTGGAGNVSAAAPSFSFGSSAKLPSVSSGNTFPVFGKKDTNDKPTFGVPMSSKSTGQFGDNGFSFGVPVTNVSTFSAC